MIIDIEISCKNLHILEAIKWELDIYLDKYNIYKTGTGKGMYTFTYNIPNKILLTFVGRRNSLREGTDLWKIIIPRNITIGELKGKTVLIEFSKLKEYGIYIEGTITDIKSTMISKPL